MDYAPGAPPGSVPLADQRSQVQAINGQGTAAGASWHSGARSIHHSGAPSGTDQHERPRPSTHSGHSQHNAPRQHPPGARQKDASINVPSSFTVLGVPKQGGPARQPRHVLHTEKPLQQVAADGAAAAPARPQTARQPHSQHANGPVNARPTGQAPGEHGPARGQGRQHGARGPSGPYAEGAESGLAGAAARSAGAGAAAGAGAGNNASEGGDRRQRQPPCPARDHNSRQEVVTGGMAGSHIAPAGGGNEAAAAANGQSRLVHPQQHQQGRRHGQGAYGEGLHEPGAPRARNTQQQAGRQPRPAQQQQQQGRQQQQQQQQQRGDSGRHGLHSTGTAPVQAEPFSGFSAGAFPEPMLAPNAGRQVVQPAKPQQARQQQQQGRGNSDAREAPRHSGFDLGAELARLVVQSVREHHGGHALADLHAGKDAHDVRIDDDDDDKLGDDVYEAADLFLQLRSEAGTRGSAGKDAAARMNAGGSGAGIGQGLTAQVARPVGPPTGDVVKLVVWVIHARDEMAQAEGMQVLENKLREQGAKALQGTKVVEMIAAVLDNPALPLETRYGALLCVSALVEALEAAAEPYALPLIGLLADTLADKARRMREDGRDIFFKLAYSVMPRASGPAALLHVLPPLCDPKKHPEAKMVLLRLLRTWVDQEPQVMARCLPQLVPAVSSVMNDSHTRVAAEATELLQAAAAHLGNKDVEEVVPRLVRSIRDASEVVPAVHALGATTFVQAVDAPTLSVLVPLLVRGLRERGGGAAAVQRKCCMVADNMAALVEEPRDAAVFLPRLAPEVEKVANEAADPELRQVADRCSITLAKVAAIAQEHDAHAEGRRLDVGAVADLLREEGPEALKQPAAAPCLQHTAACLLALAQQGAWAAREWDHSVLRPFVGPFVGDVQCSGLATAMVLRCQAAMQASHRVKQYVDEEPGDPLCDCAFSLAYGAKTLLNNAQLALKRGRRYGLVGPNGVGKSTLLRAISRGQVEGFPSRETLRTVYVEHEIDASRSTTPAAEWVATDPEVREAYADAAVAFAGTHADSAPAADADAVQLHGGLDIAGGFDGKGSAAGGGGGGSSLRTRVESMLASLGFTAEMQAKSVSELSGGWKMKLALARAMLLCPDLLLLDEPTNHLDVTNTAWLTHYLAGLTGVSCIVVSHDSSFLDAISTHIIHFEGRKLRVHKGNLADFVKTHPEARAYYSLAAAEATFHLPEPGFLEGVKTKDKAIAKMLNVSFAYPGAPKPLFEGASGYITLSSKIAVLGPNGAGKTTLVKVLTGELEPTAGSVWRHPNLRIAAVAQHAFTHLEQHLDKTPNQYIQWRFAAGEDREGLAYAARQMSAEDEARMRAARASLASAHGGKALQVAKLLGRRKLKRSYEYEVQWLGAPTDQTSWLPRELLEEMGCGKLVADVDIREAAAQGLHARPLTTAAIQAHLMALGLDPEFTTHSQMRGLSGGQKVKVVLAAATWQCPHVLVLDEPTNYLDRDSLGALAAAIKDFGGGVVMISHHDEFTSALCPERWLVKDGTVVREGDLPASARDRIEPRPWETHILDAFGNTVRINKAGAGGEGGKKKLSNKERKVREKLRKACRDRGEVVTSSSEEEDEA